MAKLKLKIITPTQTLRDTEADMVVVPGCEGELGIMSKHIALLANLRAGFIKLYDGEQIKEKLFIDSGICQVEDNNCTVLIEKEIDLKGITQEEILTKISNLKEVVADKVKSGEDKSLLQLQLEIESLEVLKEAL